MNNIPQRLQEIVEDFSFCEGSEKLEYLLELSEDLKPLPDWLFDKRDDMEEVHECMSPVFLFAEEVDSRFYFHFDIPPEAPTVRGFATILQQGLDGATVVQIQAIPFEFFLKTGLQHVISQQRMNGISGMLGRMKVLAQ